MSIHLIVCIANLDLCLYSWLLHLGHDSHGNTPLSFILCLMVRFNLRQNPHRQAVRIQRFTIYFSRTASDGGWLNRSIGLIVPPPIPVGGAPYAVTHSRRKYHHPRMCLMASALPGAVCGAGGIRSFPPGDVPPFPVKISPRTRRLASHIRNVSGRPIQLCFPEHPL